MYVNRKHHPPAGWGMLCGRRLVSTVIWLAMLLFIMFPLWYRNGKELLILLNSEDDTSLLN